MEVNSKFKDLMVDFTKWMVFVGTGQEILLDFNRCLFHVCLECYPEDIIHPHVGQTLKQMHALTMQRKTDLISMGYKYIDVWEHQFHGLILL